MPLSARNCWWLIASLAYLCAMTGGSTAQADANPSNRGATDEKVAFFERDVRPLLAEHCWKCHGEKKQESGLRLDSRSAVLSGGDNGEAATPGNAATSLIVQAVRYDGMLRMPPRGKLSDRQIATLRRWIDDGLAWPDSPPSQVATATIPTQQPLWSLQPMTEPAIPNVKNEMWCSSPIDRFVLSRLEEAGLGPAPAADRRTLMRRTYFDLLGLPPAPEEVSDFVRDVSPDAFARQLDRLLASPRYGERWGRHWLDVARYADSNGLDENLAYVHAFRYRDYVVASFNADKPYADFVREQIAGDLLDPCEDETVQRNRLVATGFLTLGAKMLAEDDPVKMEMDIIDEQLDTMGCAFLGMTLGCARCHDHKFDPVSMADYYALAGIFKSTRTMDNFKVVAQWHERPLGTREELDQRAKHLARMKAAEAALAEATEKAKSAAIAESRRRLADYLLAATRLRNRFPLASLLPATGPPDSSKLPDGTIIREAESFTRGNVEVDRSSYGEGIGVIFSSNKMPDFVEYDIEIVRAAVYQLEFRYAAAESRPLRLVVDGRLRKSDTAAGITGSWNPDTQTWHAETALRLSAGKTTFRLERPNGPFPHVDRLALVPVADFAEGDEPETLEVAAERGNLRPTILRQWVEHLREAQSRKDSPWQLLFAVQEGTNSSAANWSGDAGEVARLLLASGEPATLEMLAGRYKDAIDAADRTSEAESPSNAAFKALRRVIHDPKGPFRLPTPPESCFDKEDLERLAHLKEDVEKLRNASPPPLPQAMAVEEGIPTDLPIHLRGSHLNLGEIVPRGFSRLLGDNRSTRIATDRSGRRDLAECLTNPDHPLLARVLANRVWRWHFGEGIVRSTDNFGRLGERPSHPALLDWLALRFHEEGTSIKAMHRTIMLSSTYQMSTAYNPAADKIDPDNRLLWRRSRTRLDAESIRDSLLFVGGQLVSTMGGSVLQSKPREYVTGTASVNTANYVSNRRSLYLPVIRSAVYDMFQSFDFAEPSTPNGNRRSTTIAPQALFLMNGDIVQEQSLALARSILTDEMPRDRERIHRLYEQVLGRLPRVRELERTEAFLGRYDKSLAARDPGLSADERKMKSWQALCRVLLSTSEFLYVE